MYKNFKIIHIVFENCEHIKVPAEDIDYIYVNNLKESFSKPWHKENTLSFMKDCDSFVINFKNKNEYKRALDHQDITQIHIYETENTDELGDIWFHVPWGEGEWSNDKQDTKVVDGLIEITIK